MRGQLETLLAEKGRLAQENERLAHENEGLQGLLDFTIAQAAYAADALPADDDECDATSVCASDWSTVDGYLGSGIELPSVENGSPLKQLPTRTGTVAASGSLPAVPLSDSFADIAQHECLRSSPVRLL